MMKTILVSVIIFLFFRIASSNHLSEDMDFSKQISSTIVSFAESLCDKCRDDVLEAEAAILLVVVEIGIDQFCNETCAELIPKWIPGSPTLEAKCDNLCVKEFNYFLQNGTTIIDDIYFCEELLLCPRNNHADAVITSFDIQPTSGPVGTTFTFKVTYNTTRGTGLGEIDLDVDKVDSMDDSIDNPDRKPGMYGATFKKTANLEDDFLKPGDYHANVTVWNGRSYSKHGKALATGKTKFQITKS